MAVAGTLTYKTEVDQTGIQKGMQKTGSIVKSVVAGLGIAKLVSSTMNVIKDSIDGATKRIDTLNNFPKVMQNFGVSADEASESVKRIDKSVQGLPTSLDQAVAGVQDLFMVTKDLKQSEQLFKAVNDSAMVFANGSTEAVDRFIYGYKQAMSAGKVSAQDFNQMNEAIPGLMSKVAEKMGVSYKELKEGLSNGSISVDQFNDALKSLDTEGVGSMESLEKTAHTATGGIQTSMENMKTAITRGVAGIITSIDESLSSFGGISGIMTTVGKTAEEAFKMLGGVLKEVMPILIEFGNTIMPIIVDAVKKVAPLISELGKKLLPAIQKILQKLAPAISHIIEKLLPVAMSLIDALIPLIEPLTDYILAMIDYMMALADPLLDIASVILPPLFSILSKILKTVLPVLTGWIQTLTGILTGTWGVIKNIVNFIIGIPDIIGNIISSIVNFVTTITGMLYNALMNILNFIKTIPGIVLGIITNIINFVKQIPNYIGFAIGYIAGLIVKFVTQDIPNFITTLINFIKELPGKIMEVITNLAKTVAQWFSTAKTNVINKTKDIVTGIINWFKNLPSNISKILNNVITNVGTWLSNMYNKCKTEITKLVSKIIDLFGKLPGKMLNIGKDIVKGIWNGIKGAKDWILGKIGGFAKGVVKGFKKALKIGSPSKVMANEIGQWIPKGVAVGIEANIDSVTGSLDDMYKEMNQAIKLENGKMNLNTVSGDVYNKTFFQTPISIDLNAEVEMESQKVGRLVTPSVVKTIKTGGGTL